MKQIKGIILAGGFGSRLSPLTLGTSKQLLPVYDKPMIYYPLSVFMSSGIKNILIITTSEDSNRYKHLLGNGKKLGIEISYAVQDIPNGIAESFIIGEDFIGDDDVCLILGDNIFHGDELYAQVEKAKENLDHGFSTIFGIKVDKPEIFGVINFSDYGDIISIVEKPKNPSSRVIVSGLYFYTNDVIKLARDLKPSDRGEKEITDINNLYLNKRKLKLNLLNDSISWIDTGTYGSLIKASKFFEDFERKTKKKSSCIEEIAFRMGYINKNQLKIIGNSMKNSEYGKYILDLTK